MPLNKKKRPYKTWVEVSEKDLLHNLKLLRKIVGPKVNIAAVVKANAYGHGIKEASSIFADADWFAVDSFEEGVLLREFGARKSILVLGYTPKANLEEAIKNNLSLTIYDKKALKSIASIKSKNKIKIHLKIETGLNRQGIPGKDLLAFAKELKKHKERVELEGVSTHFADVEDTLDTSFAKSQLSSFKKAIVILKKEGVKPKIIHCGASAAALLYSWTHFNMVRIGISLYGLWPSKETQIALKQKRVNLKLKPALSWKSVVAQVKYIDKGDSVGYGRTWFAQRRSRIAVIPVGYYDGYDRSLSNSARVLVNGKSAPVIGRVAMNMIMADVTEIKNVKEEDEVVLIGKSGEERIEVEELANNLNTINYEVVTRINPNIPRVIV